ncbi:MAG: hypothetical protein CSA21_00535 [Deltaproteobacteria bacterium]|nr:MAG: hypothetical protein CSA21_00535 [Deltaproteobacteria bacterium]
MRRKTGLLQVLLCAALLLPLCSHAVEVPEQLEPWVPWVLHDQDDRLCTFSFDGKKRFCVWPDPLVLDLNTSGGSFSQRWKMEREGWIILPGKEQHWPQKVTINSIPALVVNKNGIPAIHVTRHDVYEVSGAFIWKGLPESLPLPAGTAIVDLTVNGNERQADITGDTLWISAKSQGQAAQVEDTVSIQVYRLIQDTIPMMVTSSIRVQVSGKPREIRLDWPLPEDQIPVSLESPLPVKIGTDQRIHLKARPGNHEVIFRSRLEGPVDALTLANSELGPATEYWSFEARNRLRMVKISGEPPAVDPGQTSIPQQWQTFPAYLVKKGQTLHFETLKRGNPEPQPNALAVHRTIWLDSNGAGMTVQDNLSGTVYREPRLEMQAPAVLGRMVINGRDQLITRVSDTGPAGVEVRHGQIQAMAVSRIEKARSFPAGGWGQSISRLSGELVLPPGWSIFHATGMDRARTWISRWTLLDSFIVLIIVITTFKLLGPLAGGTALLALLLSYHDRDAPVFIWLALLSCIAIIRALPDSRYTHLVQRLKLGLLIGLAVLLLPYSAQQLRIGFFPQLERVFNPYIQAASIADDTMFLDKEAIEESLPTRKMSALQGLSLSKNTPATGAGSRQQQTQELLDIHSKVQAGPGVPSKKWRIIELSWNGPVEKDLQMHLFLLSPRINLLLACLKVIMVFLLAFFMLDRKQRRKKSIGRRQGGSTVTTLLVVTILLGGVSIGHCADYPDKDLLDDLRNRLLQPASCTPHCADLESMHVTLQDAEIGLVLQAGAATETALLLPTGTGISWQKITLDDVAVPAFAEKTELWLAVPEGPHTITMKGRLNQTDVQLQLPQKPHLVTVNGHNQWSVKGLDKNGVPENRLQFVRQQQHQDQQEFAASTLPPLMQVERVLHLGLQWRVETIITRLSPPGSSVYLAIPLLTGESLTDPGFTVEQGKVQVHFHPQERKKQYHSAFKKQAAIELTAPDTSQWYEIWRLNISPIWHVEPDGFAPILHHSQSGIWQPEWHPWPQERLALTVTRPKGVPGPTKTIESSSLQITPGLRSTAMALTFTIRSTRGDQQSLTLPKDAIIESVRINGQDQPVKKSNVIVLPLLPDRQQVEIQWRTSTGISTLFTVPKIDLGSESVNANIEIRINDRWIWFVKGPQMGPALLFYSELLILVLVSILLGRSQLTPLKSYHWLILGAGLCQSGLAPGLIIVAWFILLKIRQDKGDLLKGLWFNLSQLGIVLLSLAALSALAFAVRNGLLGHPDMLISGNGSNSHLLRWYQDLIPGTTLPSPMVVSIPIMAYRITMLAWALWLAFHLLRWVTWGWACFTTGRLWQKSNRQKNKKKQVADPPSSNAP